MPEPQAITADDLKQTREELLSAVRSELGSVRQELEKVRAPAAPPPAPPVQTLEQIQELVDKGVLTPTQGQDRIAAIRTAAMKEELRQELAAERNLHERGGRIRSEIQAYQKAVPAVMQQGSPERTRVEKEFARLQELGYPNDVTTELLALRVALGDAAEIREHTTERRPTHEESTAGAGASGDGASGGSAPAGVPARLRSHYEKMISQGAYSGWEDPKLQDELKRARVPKKVAA